MVQITWFKVDDKLPDNRKTRAVRKSHPVKRRDASPFGIWALAGAWTDDGYVPLEWLEDQDDDAFELAERLVTAGLWHHTTRDGEPGYVFHDWHAQNPVKGENDPSVTGTFGNHVRWHVQRKVVEADCRHCPSETAPSADIGAIAPDIAPDIAPSRPESLPSRPVPTRSRPEPEPTALADKSAPNRFDDFWDAFAYKKKRPDAERAWTRAIRKADPDFIIQAARQYVAAIAADKAARGDRAPDQAYPASWLNSERWADDLTPPQTPAQPETRVQGWLRIADDFGEQDRPNQIRAIGGSQ